MIINLCFFCLLSLLVFYIARWLYFGSQFPKWSFYVSQTSQLLILNLLSFFLINRWFTSQHFPLSNLYESLVFLAWGLCFLGTFIELKSVTFSSSSFKTLWFLNTLNPVISFLTVLASLLLIAFASLKLPNDLQKMQPLVPALQSNWLMMHVSIMLLSYVVLILGCLLSILFLIFSSNSFKSITEQAELLFYSKQTETLILDKAEKKNLFLRQIDQFSYRFIGIGFPLLTIGIISGAVWANEAWGSYWSWDPKETWALITWFIFAFYLHSRINFGWKGLQPAQIATVGFLILWICYLGVNLMGKGLHSYGFFS